MTDTIKRLGSACIGALLGALLVFVGLFILGFLGASISPVLSWLMMVVANHDRLHRWSM